ncbi:MAG: helix-turn-helix transcriptional regulator [Cyclobacteriaceae bacterium]
MSINKNAIIRYRTLDKCFRNPGRRYFIEDLLEACNLALIDFGIDGEGVKRRQLYDDIRFMESEQGWSIPLLKKRDGKKTWYRYEDTNFSIDNQPMNEAEANHLREAISLLQRFKGLPQFEWINELIPKLEHSFKLKPIEQEIMGFDSNEFLKGIEYIEVLFNAIFYKRVLKIDYKSFKSEIPSSQIIHPYYLKQFNNRWFLFGHNHDLNMITNLALDRIICVDETNFEYRENELDFYEFFEDVIGVTRPEDTEIITLKLQFSTSRAPYVLTKPIHGSQKKVSLDENGLIITIEVIPNFELDQLILSFGADVKVLEPGSYQNKIHTLLKNAIKKYE